MKTNDWLSHKFVGPLQIAALLTWLTVGYFLLRPFPVDLSQPLELAEVLGLLGFLVAMFTAWAAESKWLSGAGLCLMPASLLLVSWAQASGIHLVLNCIFAGTLPYFVAMRWAAPTVLSVHIALVAMIAFRWSPAEVWLQSGSTLGFAIFALFSSYSAMRERAAREELDEVHKQLLATQQLLTDRALEDERLRISRDLHDSLGHHLTALSLQLEVAHHLSDTTVREHVDQAQGLTKLLLTDVRQVVSDLRVAPELDIGTSIRQMAKAAKTEIVLDIEELRGQLPARVTEALFRTVQEIITNCNRHSQCSVMTIRLRESTSGWELSTEENTKQPVTITPGSGLKGMRERIEKLGGSLQLNTNAGLSYKIHLPKHDPA